MNAAAPDNLTPFEPGNTAAVTHGAYSLREVSPRATEIAEDLRPFVPNYEPRLEPMLTILALHLARIERMEVYAGEHGDLDDKGRPRPFLARLPTIQAEARRCLAALGMDNTPPTHGRSRRRRTTTGGDLERHLARVHGGGDDARE